jgi:hypothetical protein
MEKFENLYGVGEYAAAAIAIACAVSLVGRLIAAGTLLKLVTVIRLFQ